MDYRSHYDRLMLRASCRALIGYRERHHVIPRCLGGPNVRNNIVELTAEEHYVAHQLLVKMYPGNKALIVAAHLMSTRCINSRSYGWLRRRLAEVLRGNKYAVGMTLSAEARAKISASKVGKQRPDGLIENLASARRGISLSAEHRAKISAASKGHKKPPRSQQWRDKQARAHLGRRHTLETRAKMSASHMRRAGTVDSFTLEVS